MFELLIPLGSVIAGLETTALAQFVGHTPNVYLVVSALHVLGIALLVGPILIVDAWLIGLVRHHAMQEIAPMLTRVGTAGFALAATMGACLFVVQAAKYAGSLPFLCKIGLLGIAGANALALRKAAGPIGCIGRSSTWTRAAGMISAVTWVAAILAGRWIAFA